MRRPFALLVTPAASVLMMTISLAYADSTTLPQRKAGLWELNTTMDEGGSSRDQSMKICIDADMEKNTVQASLEDHRKACTTYDIKVADGTTTVDADCLFSTRKVISQTKMSGDFQNNFEVKIESTTSGVESNAQTIVVKRIITQNGKYLGESCGDLKGGEAEGSDGTRMLVQ